MLYTLEELAIKNSCSPERILEQILLGLLQPYYITARIEGCYSHDPDPFNYILDPDIEAKLKALDLLKNLNGHQANAPEDWRFLNCSSEHPTRKFLNSIIRVESIEQGFTPLSKFNPGAPRKVNLYAFTHAHLKLTARAYNYLIDQGKNYITANDIFNAIKDDCNLDPRQIDVDEIVDDIKSDTIHWLSPSSNSSPTLTKANIQKNHLKQFNLEKNLL